ncbi:hypothetical protein HDV01_000509 [Terramyces sp. JEL0728]|nr:hypothetical protein HDV01_000509 [Terramyces sp. JEL0728]
MNDQEKLAILKDAVDQLCGEVTHLLILFKSQVQDETTNENEISIQNKSLVYQSILAEWSLIKSLFTLLVSNIANIDQDEILSPIETILVKMKTDDAVFKNYEFQFPFHVNAMVNTVKTAFKNFCSGPKEEEQPRARSPKRVVTTAPIETTNVRDAAKKFQEISENIAESAKLKRPQTKRIVIGAAKGSGDARTPDSALSGATLVGPKSALYSPDEQEELKVDDEMKGGKLLGKTKSYTVRAMPTTVKYVSVQKDDGAIDVVAQKIKLPANALDAYKSSVEDLKKEELCRNDSRKGQQPQQAVQHHVEVGKILSAKEQIGEHIISQKSDIVFTPDSSSIALKDEDMDVVDNDLHVKFKLEGPSHAKAESYSTPTSLINSYFVDDEGNSLPTSSRASKSAQAPVKIDYKETILDQNRQLGNIRAEINNEQLVRKLTDQFDNVSRNEEIVEETKKTPRSRIASVSEEVDRSRKGSVNDNPFQGSQQKSGDSHSRKTSAVTASFPVDKTTFSPADAFMVSPHKKTDSSSSHKKTDSTTFADILESTKIEAVKISPTVAAPPKIAPQLNIAKRAPTLQTKLDAPLQPTQAPVLTPKSATFAQPAPVFTPKSVEQAPKSPIEVGQASAKEISRAHTFTPKSALKISRAQIPTQETGTEDVNESNYATLKSSKTISIQKNAISPNKAAPQLPQKVVHTEHEVSLISENLDHLISDLDAQVDFLNQRATIEGRPKSDIETYRSELEADKDANKRFSEPIENIRPPELHLVKHIEFDLEAQAFAVEKTEVVVTESVSRRASGNQAPKIDNMLKSPLASVPNIENRSRSNTGKLGPEKISVHPESLSAPPKSSNRDTIISPNPAAQLFSLVHDRQSSGEPHAEIDYLAPKAEPNQSRKLSSQYMSKRQSWNVKPSIYSENETPESSNHSRNRSDPHLNEIPSETGEMIIIPLSKDEATKVISDSAQILNAYFDGDSLTNLLTDFPDVELKDFSERKNSAASVRTIIKQPRHLEPPSNSKLSNSFSLEELPDDENENSEMARYHTIIPKSKKKGKEKLSIALLEKSLHAKSESFETDSSFGGYSQRPSEKQDSVVQRETQSVSSKPAEQEEPSLEAQRSPPPEISSQEYKSQLGIIPPQINKATKPKKLKSPEKELEDMQELKKISDNVAKRRHEIESIVINDKDYVLSIMSTFSSIQNQIYGAATPDKSAEDLDKILPSASPETEKAPPTQVPPPPPPLERKITGIKTEDSFDPKPLSAKSMHSPVSETLKSKPSISSKPSLSRNANKVYVNTNASNDNLTKGAFIKSPTQTDAISENEVEAKPTLEQQISVAKHTSAAESNMDDHKNQGSYKFWSSKKKDDKSHPPPTKPITKVNDPDKDANTFMVNSKFFDPVNSTAGLYDVEKSLDSFTTSEYPIIPKLWLDRVTTFHLIMIPLNGMFDMQAIDLKESHRFGRNNTTNHPAFKGFGTLVVSRNHVDVFEREGKVAVSNMQVYIKDIGSNSGTFRNNARLSQPGQTSPDVELVTGDYIQLGKDYLQDENNVLDSNGRIQARRRCVRFQLIVVSPGKTAFEAVKDQLYHFINPRIPIERPINRSDTNDGPTNIEDEASPKHNLAVDAKSPETAVPLEKIDKSKTMKRAVTERQPGEISAVISNIQNDKLATPNAVYKSTKDVLSKLAEALDAPKTKEIITKREHRLTIQDARPNYNCSYDLFLETKPGAKSPAKLKQFCEGQPWQVVKNNGAPIGHMIFSNEIKLELFPAVKSDNSISLSGDFKEQRFMCIKKALQTREQKVVGECKGKYMSKKSLRETNWLTNFEIQGEEATQMVLSGVILICLMTP